MKSAALLIAVAILLMMAPGVILSLDDFRLTDQVDTYVVTTDNATTSTTQTLSQDLFNNHTSGVSISSNYTSDAPIASSYSSTTNVLTITGLAVSQTRMLTVTYDIDHLDDYWGAGTSARVVPAYYFLGIMCIVAAAIYLAFKHGGE